MLELVDSTSDLGIPSKVVMAEHDTLGVARGAAGVDQCAALVYSDPSQTSFKLIIAQSFPPDHQVLKTKYILSSVVCERNVVHLPTDDSCIVRNAGVLDNLLDIWKLIPDAPDLVQLLLVLHHQYGALAVIQNIFASLCTIGWVDASCEASGKDSAKVRYDPLGRVEPKNADTIKPLHSKVDEGLRNCSDILVVS